MSRTDKDAPHWVTAAWWKPYHWRCPNGFGGRYNGWNSLAPTRECDLPAEPVITWIDPGPTRQCMWVPVWDRHHWPNPPHWYITHVWTARERLAARVDCLNAAKEHRATGEVDTIPTVRQNRHCAQWLWD